MKNYVITVTVDTVNSTIRIMDNNGVDCMAQGYFIVIGMGKENDLVTAFGDSEAIAEAFANAYGTANTNDDGTSRQMKKLLNKCIMYARSVASQLFTEIQPKEALEKFEATCECREGECKCRGKKTSFH
jgi:hypothetical protein